MIANLLDQDGLQRILCLRQNGYFFPSDGVFGKYARLVNTATFTPQTNCTGLSMLDATVTVLYIYDPRLLERLPGCSDHKDKSFIPIP